MPTSHQSITAGAGHVLSITGLLTTDRERRGRRGILS